MREEKEVHETREEEIAMEEVKDGGKKGEGRTQGTQPDSPLQGRKEKEKT